MKKLMRKTVSLLCVISMLAALVICVVAGPASAADDFDYSGVTNESWLYDFKALTGTADEHPAFIKQNPNEANADSLNSWFTGAGNTDGNKSYFDEDGLHVFTNYNNNALECYTNTNGTTACRRVMLWDYDYAKDIFNWDQSKNEQYGLFPNKEGDRNIYASWAAGPDIINRGGFVALKDGLYAVTMKFRVPEMNTATGRIDINIGVYNDSSFPSWANNNIYQLHRNGYMLDYVTVTKASDEWLYYTAIIDGSKFKGNGKNVIALFISNDKYTADGTYNQIDIESVSVERYYDSINGEFGAKFYDADNQKGARNVDNATVNGKNYILGSGGGSPESVFELPEPQNSDNTRVFKMWKTKMGYEPPASKAGWDSGYGGYTGDTYTMQSLQYGNIRYFEATYVTDNAPSSTEPVVYNWDLETMYRNKRTLGDGIMISGNIGTENTISYSLKYTADGLSFRSNGASGKLPESNVGAEYYSAQRISFYTGLGADESSWSGNYVRFKYGYTYKFSMVYKAEGVDSYGTQIGLASIINDEYGGYKWGPTRLLKTWSATTDTNGWVHVTYFFTADEFAADNIATFAIQTNAGVITVREATIEESYGDVNGKVSNIYFRDNSPNTPNPFSGFVGDTHGTLPTPTNFGYEFVEWCTDKSLTQKYTGTAFPEEDITLYAKWKISPTVYTFDKVNLESRGTTSSATFFQVKDGDNYVMKYTLTTEDFENDNTLQEYSTYRRLSLNDGNWNHYALTPGVEYTVTLRYKVLSVEEEGSISLSTSRRFLIWSNYIERQGGEQKYGTASDEWKTMEFKFVPKIDTSDPKITDANHLNICMNGKAVILFDDVTVTPGEARANYYGNLVRFNTGDGERIDPICGEEGEKLTLPTPKRDGYAFGGWFLDAEFTTPYTATVFGAEDVTVYAQWLLGKYTEGFENYSETDKMLNFSSGWIFNDKTMGGDAANVRSGNVSLQRNASTAGSRGFSIMRKVDDALTVGKQYTLSFYVKPEEVTDVMVVMNLMHMGSPSSTSTPRATEEICNFEKLAVGEWNRVDVTFTAQAPYVGLSLSGGNNVYFDDFTVTLQGYTGVATGEDTTGLNIAMLVMTVAAMGALLITGVCVFRKVRQ